MAEAFLLKVIKCRRDNMSRLLGGMRKLELDRTKAAVRAVGVKKIVAFV